ncbi:hypothetical protein, partial [Microbacterium sp.]|uniref:hypothetical protein n=1 Tax=Microbacterium sp. TaxID=51671 RepID=UPI0026314FE2
MSRTEQRKKRHHLGSLALAAAVTGALVAPMIPTAAVAAAPAGIDGEGIAAAPYEIDSAADLRALTEWINADSGARAGSHIDLTADIDMSGEAPLRGIDTFTGVLDGQGHTISGLVYGDRDTNNGRLSLIQRLDGGTVTNLTLSDLSADNATSSGFVAGIAIHSVGGTITGNTILDADLSATSAEKVGGLVAEADGGVISDNFVDATLAAGEMPAGIAAYAKNATTITRNLVSADITMAAPGGTGGEKGNNAGMIVGYPGTPNSSAFTANVALSGSIAYEGKIDGFVGRIVGYTAYDGWSASDNLAST